MISSCTAVAPPDALTPDNVKKWRERLIDYVTKMNPDDAEAWGCLADAYVSDHLNTWNEANDPTNLRLLREAEKAVAKSERLAASQDIPIPSVTRYAKGMLHRAKGEHNPHAVTEFKAACDGDPRNWRYAAQYANQLINIGAVDAATLYISAAINNGADDLSAGVFDWILGRKYFFGDPPDYDNAINWLKSSILKRDNLWYSRLYLVAAYALRHGPDDLNAASDELGQFLAIPEFSCYTISRVREYEKCIPPHGNDLIRKGLDRLYEGLKTANLPH